MLLGIKINFDSLLLNAASSLLLSFQVACLCEQGRVKL
jgi:hypothetical protein